MSRFFIDRPIFAWVIAIVIMLAGALSIAFLPVAQYPDIAPPSINISANYPGASPETAENSVTQVIEQQLTGLDGLIYFSSTSDANGGIGISAVFKAGVNPDIAQVQVQNKLQLALPRLPQDVQRAGVFVQKAQAGFLMIAALYDDSGRMTTSDIGDYVGTNLYDSVSRITGVGQAQIFGGQYAIRIWLDPYKLQQYGLTTDDINNAVLAQDAQVSAGQIGAQPSPAGQQLNAVVTAQSRLQTPEEFRQIVLKGAGTGAVVRLSDVARVELGNENYNFLARLDGKPSAGLAIQLAPGANALQTSEDVKAKIAELSSSFPPGLKVVYPMDSTPFIRISISEVIKTLVEAILLVVVVMFVFLQDWRATLIPTIAVPVVLLGAFAVLHVAGFTINTLTMFGMVLAIGLLVDDAIVVVENVERIMREEGLSPKEATKKSMDEITGALVGIGLVLTAVFLPMAFFGGSVGVIYRQFSITIVSAMVLSVLVALVLTPALCATLLKPIAKGDYHEKRGFFGWFNRNFAASNAKYEQGLGKILGRPLPAMIGYGLAIVLLAVLFVRMPTSFLPNEDQGLIINLIQLPPGAIQSRAVAVARQGEAYFMKQESNTEHVFAVNGFSYAGPGQNSGMMFVRLKDWDERKAAKDRAPAIVGRAIGAYSRIRDGQIVALQPPPVNGLGSSSGFDMELVDRSGLGHDGLLKARNQLLAAAAKDPMLSQVRPNGQEDTPQLHIDVDQAKAAALGVTQASINSTISTALGGEYVTDFIDRNRVKKVYVQADAPFRSSPEDIDHWYVRAANGTMTPFSAFASSHWVQGPARLERFNGQAAFEIQGQPAEGASSGAAMNEMEKLAGQIPGVGVEWTGLSFQERLSGDQAPALYALSMLVVFLCLAALYESWSVPISVLMVAPLGVVGAVLAASLRGLNNDIYFQVALITTIGLSAKNAILIVEFAEAAERAGKTPREAAEEAARLRLRPILMTSLAFIAGVTPLALSTGAGAGSQNDIGTGVIGGMLTATFLAIFLVPLFYVLVRGWFRNRKAKAAEVRA
ncbi:MAG TPA: efflux RND transporter permease subunit [Caulobacteraceae bacterium]|jgi:multidrug efflux pump